MSVTRVAIIRPANDRATKWLSEWADLLAGLELPLSDLRDLAGDKADRSSVEHYLRTHDASFFFCHGRPDALLGADSVIVDFANIESARGRIIVALACHSALDLGERAIKHGVVGYVGFDHRLCISLHGRERFGHAVIKGLVKLLSGGSVAEAVEAMQIEFENLVEYYMYGPGAADTHNPSIWLLANWNKTHLVFKGDPAGTLSFSAEA
jgi:hypothetical protein